MNIYEDYKSYMNEHASLLKKLNEHNSKILICILDVIKVTDYIYQKFIKNEFINEPFSFFTSLPFTISKISSILFISVPSFL